MNISSLYCIAFRFLYYYSSLKKKKRYLISFNDSVLKRLVNKIQEIIFPNKVILH